MLRKSFIPLIFAALSVMFLSPRGRPALEAVNLTVEDLVNPLGLDNPRSRLTWQLQAARLAADVRKFGHINTGFLGAFSINPMLSDKGYDELACRLLLRKKYPSWLYPVARCATPIWERWDGIRPDGSFQNPGMNSFNHYAYGALGDWLYRYVADLAPNEERPVHPQRERPPNGDGVGRIPFCL